MSYRILLACLLVATGVQVLAQEVGGCTSYFGSNYDPDATFNNGTCDYDLQQLLKDGYQLGDLLFSGVLPSELEGLFGAGGFIVDVDFENRRALIAWPFSSGGMSDTYDQLIYTVDGNEFLATDFSGDLYGGQRNWEIIKASDARRGGNNVATSSTFTGNLGHWPAMGYYDWFVPNEAELIAYAQTCYSKFGGYSGTSTSWDLNPNSAIFYDYMYACGSYYPFNGSEVWTSDLQNLNSAGTATFNALNPGGSYVQSWVDGVSSTPYSGNNNKYVFPMRIEELAPPGTLISCSDWIYGESGDQANEVGVPCAYPLFSCDSAGSALWDGLDIGAYPSNTSVVEYGRSDTRDILLNVPATHEIDGNIYDVIEYVISDVSGVPTGLTANYAAGDVITGSEVACFSFEGNALQEGVFDVVVNGTLYMDILGSTLNVPITLEHRIAVVPNASGILGCVYTAADNYNVLATIDDGSCTFGNLCPGDFNGDDLIGVQDILYLLGLYNTSCD